MTADGFRDALRAKGIQLYIPGRGSQNELVRYDKRRYWRRSRVEIMFGRLKDRRRVATYGRCQSPSSSPPPSQPPSFSACEQRVLALAPPTPPLSGGLQADSDPTNF
jgi:hypothetical protein